jgi:hypothetical protein
VGWTDIHFDCDFVMQLYNRLLAAVNNASFLAHLEKLQDESAHLDTELSSGNMEGFLAKFCRSLTIISLLSNTVCKVLGN